MILRALLAALSLILLPAPASSSAQKPSIAVKGKHLVNGAGKDVRLLGINRSGFEYACVESGQIFDGPSDPASIKAMKRWHVNAVRLPLNETCWLGINEVDPAVSGAPYREAVRNYAAQLEAAGLYVILDLQWAQPGEGIAKGLIPMADADHALDFWRSVATEFSGDHSVIFDLFNEPQPGISWECWKSGCEAEDEYHPLYPAAGMQQMVDAVRSTGARQPLMLSGNSWGVDLGGWLAYKPYDPVHALIASAHAYDFNPCPSYCKRTWLKVSERVPLVLAEMGQSDCKHYLIDEYMRWADQHDVSYLAWTWNAGPGWGCTEGPSLIDNYAGHPTAFGIGFREHLRKLTRDAKRKLKQQKKKAR